MSKNAFHLIIISSICFLSINCMNKSGQNTTGMNHTPPLSTATPKAVNNNNDVVVNDCPESVTLIKGQSLTIKLSATEGTGYVWQVKDPISLLKSDDTDVIQYEKKPDDGSVGKASKQIMRFTAVKVGTETMVLVYLRPFDKDVIAEKCTIRVTVQ